MYTGVCMKPTRNGHFKSINVKVWVILFTAALQGLSLLDLYYLLEHEH